MHISAIQPANYYTKSYSQPLKPQKATTVVSNADLPKDTVSFKGIFYKSPAEEKCVADEKKHAALLERYGNTEPSKVAPEIIKVAIERLEEMGFSEIKRDNIHIIHEEASYEADHDFNIITYYDENKQASVRFTNDGDLAYLAKYRYSPTGEIIDHYYYRYYDFNNKKWTDISRQSSILLPY